VNPRLLETEIQQAEAQLRSLGQRVTSARVLTLAKLIQAQKPLTHEEILTDAVAPMDRVTLYRVLDWLVKHGLVHRITADDRIWRFMVGDGRHEGQHPHFYCQNTGKMICLHDLAIPDMPLPKGLKVKYIEVVFHGECEDAL
jgi:Fur family ferric uptake transcriptional regulator